MNKDNKPVMPPAKVVCPECCDHGAFGDSICNTCQGKMEVYNYLTPEQFRAWMRENVREDWELSDDTPVRIDYDPNNGRPEEWPIAEYRDVIHLADHKLIIARPDQPAPPNDWRPE